MAVRESYKKLGDLLPDSYTTAGVAVDVDFDPSGKFGRYMDRRLKRFVKHYRRLWPVTSAHDLERADLDLPSRQDTRPQE